MALFLGYLFIYLFRNLLPFPSERHWATGPSASFRHFFLDQWVPIALPLRTLCPSRAWQGCVAMNGEHVGVQMNSAWHCWEGLYPEPWLSKLTCMSSCWQWTVIKAAWTQCKSSPDASEKRESYCLCLGGRSPLSFHFCFWSLGRGYYPSDIDYLHLGMDAEFLASKGLQEETRHGRKGHALMSFL